MKNQRLLLTAGAMAAALMLGGCWNDDDDDANPLVTNEVPDSAGISTAAFTSFLMGLSVSNESSEPMSIKDSFSVPADESTEPTPLT